MKAPQSAPKPPHAKIGSVLEVVQPYLVEVEQVIREALRSESPYIQELVEHISQYAGKRLRPALVYLAAEAVEGLCPDHVKVGAVVELIHTATLLHDDVLDQSSQRRRVKTVNAMHGNHVPILLGDFVYANAFTLANSMADGTAARVLSRITAKLCTGEVHQNFCRGRIDLREEEYYQIIDGKTACLYGACAEMGAHYGGASAAQVQALAEYGRLLGLAFQIIDDCLDLAGDEHAVGKSLGTDLNERKMTLPLMYLYEGLDAAGREDFRRIFEEPGIEDRRGRLLSRFDVEPVFLRSRERANQHVHDALAQISILPETDARGVLLQVGEFVIQRDR